MKLLFILPVVVLAGCAHNLPATVEVPVAVKCLTEDPNVPTYRFAPPYQTVFESTRDLLGDREAALAYEIELRAALKSCK